MILCDVNVLVNAHKQDAPDHAAYLRWLREALDGYEAFGVSELVLSSVVRIVTNRRILEPPSSLDVAQEFVQGVRSHPNALTVREGPRHWEIFTKLCKRVGATANLVPDAYFAALAIESGCEWITADRGFARFPGLRWRHPLDSEGTP